MRQSNPEEVCQYTLRGTVAQILGPAD